jgi:hypothetical protein
MNARTDPQFRVAELRYADAADQYYDRMQSIPVGDVIEAIPERDQQECGGWILEAIGKALDMRPEEGDALINAAVVKIRAEYMYALRDLA